MAEPIRIACEGSGCPPISGQLGHRWAGSLYLTVGMCQMCGRWHSVDRENPEPNRLEAHERDDVLAMLQRGDFG